MIYWSACWKLRAMDSRVLLTCLPQQPLSIDEVRLKLVNTHGDPLWLKSSSHELVPGRNTIPAVAMVRGRYRTACTHCRTP